MPGTYTPLFFADEAVALAAGHRPCGACRREALRAFKRCWRRTHRLAAESRLPVSEMDLELHRSRLDGTGGKQTYRVRLGDLPDGTFFILPSAGRDLSSTPCLLWQRCSHPWSHEGYGGPVPAPATMAVDVLTPAPIVAVLREGYKPILALDWPDATEADESIVAEAAGNVVPMTAAGV